jgi:hypothetical protein
MRHDEVTQLREWAISGARIQLEEIYATFPELAPTATTTPTQPRQVRPQNGQAPRAVSDAHRRKLSRMMTRRWKAARKAGLSKLG